MPHAALNPDRQEVFESDFLKAPMAGDRVHAHPRGHCGRVQSAERTVANPILVGTAIQGRVRGETQWGAQVRQRRVSYH
jgi:hypothetical protein